MDWLTGGGDLSTPMGQLVERATTAQQAALGPDYALILAVSDALDASGAGSEAPAQTVRAIRKRLRDSDPQVVKLTLALLDALVKNSACIHGAVATREVMNDMIALTDGKKGWEVREQALALLQQWGIAFQQHQADPTLGIFYQTYSRLRSSGMQFPEADEGETAPVFTPPASHTNQPQPHLQQGQEVPPGTNPAGVFQGTPASDADARVAAGPAASTAAPTAASGAGMGAAAGATGDASVIGATEGPTQTNADEFRKLEHDMNEVMEKVRLCRQMLPESPGIEQDEALAEVIGFLEACRDRMADVIEAGTQGVLGEALLEKCLKVNDALMRTLEAERNGTPIAVDDDPVTDLLDTEDGATATATEPEEAKSSSTGAAAGGVAAAALAAGVASGGAPAVAGAAAPATSGGAGMAAPTSASATATGVSAGFADDEDDFAGLALKSSRIGKNAPTTATSTTGTPALLDLSGNAPTTTAAAAPAQQQQQQQQQPTLLQLAPSTADTQTDKIQQAAANTGAHINADGLLSFAPPSAEQQPASQPQQQDQQQQQTQQAGVSGGSSLMTDKEFQDFLNS